MKIIDTPAHFVPATRTYEFDLNDPDCMAQIEAMFRQEEVFNPMDDPDFDERD